MSNHKPLSKIMLGIIAQVGEKTANSVNGYLDLIINPTVLRYGRLIDTTGINALHDKRRSRAALRNLERSNYIKTKRLGQKIFISLTSKGQIELLSGELKQAKPNPQKIYTVVIFDIPESQRAVRDQVRYLLKQSDFKKLQQSVWVSRLDNYETVRKFIKQHQAQAWLNVFRGTDFNHQPPI
ncbi:MAG: CRISPR-associated endonuclease Cas2 [Candidatus Kerfeldbacteria bacterium]|nr:CRISPR-associated endonuclease Cas2 [Candidatus Kerfeldbacteria bacterium]